MQTSTVTSNGSYLPSTGGSSHWVNNDELDEIKTVNGLLSAARFRRVPILRARAQSSHFPDPLFLPCGGDEKSTGQWGRQFWNHSYNERKTQLHTSLGVTGNTLHSGNTHALTQTQHASFLPLSSLATQRDSPNVTSNVCPLHRGVVVLLHSWLITFPLTVLAL